jgi:hypothetical protein
LKAEGIIKMKTQIKNQLGQIVKGTLDEVLKEPKKVIESAGEQTGVLPKKQESQQTGQSQHLEAEKQKDQVFSKQRIAEIESELRRIRQNQEAEKQAQERQEMERGQEQNQQKDKKRFTLPIIGKKKRQIPARAKKHSGTSELRLKE